MSSTPIGDLMSVIANVVCVFLCVFFFLSILVGTIWGMPKVFKFIEMNISEDYLENRAEKKVKDLKSQIRVIELENEAEKLEKRLSDISTEE